MKLREESLRKTENLLASKSVVDFKGDFTSYLIIDDENAVVGVVHLLTWIVMT